MSSAIKTKNQGFYALLTKILNTYIIYPVMSLLFFIRDVSANV